MNSDQPPHPPKIQANSSLKIKANSSTENYGQLLE